MNKAITVELQFFLISILWGVIILVVYDLLRILRRIIPHNSLFIALEDLVFWVLSSVFIFAMIYTMNNGTIRGFSVMGMGIGMVLYHFIVSELFVKWTSKALLLIISPIKMFLAQLKRLIKFVISKMKKVAGYFNKRLKKITKSVKIVINKHKARVNEKYKKHKELAKNRAEIRNKKKDINRRNKKSLAKHKNLGKENNHQEEPNSLSGNGGYHKPMDSYRKSKVLRSGSIPARKNKN